MIRIRFSVILAPICLMLGLALFRQVGLHSTPSANEAKSKANQTPLPDLIVDQASLRQHWVVRVEDLPAEFCSVEEGGITPGEHTLVRFTVATPNIGDADLVVGDPNQHVGDASSSLRTATTIITSGITRFTSWLTPGPGSFGVRPSAASA
jgi:hypothetical protein